MKQQWHVKATIELDAALLAPGCLLRRARFTGLVLHEWLGLAMVGMALAQLLLSWGWIATQNQRFIGPQSVRGRIYLFSLALFAGVTAAILSGILISQKAIPGQTRAKPVPERDMRWATLHSDFSDLALRLSGFHVAMNLDWLFAAAGNTFRRFRESAP